MKVRDLRQYIKTICNEIETLEQLGEDDENFLKEMSGRGQKVSALISGAASFASHAEEQLFYEFVQNAFDAQADSLFFFASKEYLIVLNNGEPFYTDFDVFTSKNPRDGQLYNFLAKGKSLKHDDETKLGKYGQGSKLLYTLLADVNHKANTEELLKQAILNEKKGPYLISWNDKAQLDSLLINGDEWIAAQADDVENHLLFAKILMSYYPVAPGQATHFFTNQEAQKAIRAFDTLVDPRRNMHFLTKGTALIIPLGEGKYDSIVAHKNLSNVRTRLGGFASITRSQEWNEGKNLAHIYVMGEEVEQHPVRSVFVEFEEGGRKFEYHFAFNPIFAEKGFVNFFKGLPILQTKYNLGFIVDSQIFEVDDSRQRINDTEKTGVQLVSAYTHLVKQLTDIKESDIDTFHYIYQALTAANFKSDDEKSFARTSFLEVFRPFLLENVFTFEGTYENFINVYSPEYKNQYNVKLTDIGICNKHWFDENTLKCYKRHFEGRKFNELSFAEMLREADKDKLTSWIKSLSKDEYKLFHENCLQSLGNITDLDVFRSNQGNLFSYKTLISSAHIYYMAADSGAIFLGQEYITENLREEYNKEDYTILYNKIATNLDLFKNSHAGKETACNILSLIAEKDTTLKVKIRSEIKLLQNWNDEYLPFCELMAERPDDTLLFDTFRIKGYTPKSLLENDWLVDNNKDKNAALWTWVKNNFGKLKQVQGWGELTHRYLADIKKIYNKRPSPHDTCKFYLFLNEEGTLVETPCYTVDKIEKRMNEQDYKKPISVFTDFSFVPYEFEKELTEAPFALDSLSTSALIGQGRTVDYETLKILVSISDRFLMNYKVIEESGKYQITNLEGGKNYFNHLDEDLKQLLLENKFYYVPDRVQKLFITDYKTYNFTTNQGLVVKVIDTIADKFKLLPIVRGCNANVITHYFDRITTIPINALLTEKNQCWQLIKFAVQHHTEENGYKEKIFSCIIHNGEFLPDTIKQNIIKPFNLEYNIYDLDGDYQEENELIDSFFKCLPSQKDIDWFKTEFYNGKAVQISCDDLYNNLKETYLTIEQLRFCIDYSINTEDANYDNLEINEDEKLEDALDMIRKNQFKGFDKYFTIKDFAANTQAYAPHAFLTKDEKLPETLHKWLDRNPHATELFAHLRTENDAHIALRKAIYVNESNNVSLPYFEQEDTTKYTIQWLLDSHIEYEYNSPAYSLIFNVIEKLPEDYQPMIFLKYSGKVATTESISTIIHPIFILEKYQENSLFLSTFSWTSTFPEMLKTNKELQEFLLQHTVYAYGFADLLSKHNLNKVPKIEIDTRANEGGYKEITSSVYDKWKKMPESKNICIMTSDKPIGVSFILLVAGEKIFSVGLDNREIGFETGKMVVVKYPNEDNLSPLKVIEKHISDMNFFKEPFIVLQGLYVEQVESWEKLAEEKGLDIHSLVDAAEKGNTNTLEDENQIAGEAILKKPNENLASLNKVIEKMTPAAIDKINDNIEAINEIVEEFDSDALRQIAENKDKLLEVLNDFMAAEDETKESLVRQTIGYIGELIYRNYLSNQGKEYHHAAIEGIGEYDFHNKTDKTYVDVKTTIYSLKDGTAPFYLHRSQNVFMQKRPNEKYHIIRISLEDLRLHKSYERIRDLYGKDANPFENVKLQKACEEIAEKYWQGAKIEEFDAASPEYAIRIEKKTEK